MPRTRRWLAIATAAPLVATALFQLPAVAASGTALPGLTAPASVVRDADGIAHIEAANEHDLLFLQGWVHAGDRLFQMDVSRRQASGTLAELLGADAVPGDVAARTIGLRRAAERSLPVQSAQVRAGLDAYAAGVNAWIAAHDLPAQYAALQLVKVEPWTPVDSLVIGKGLSFALSFTLDLDATLALESYQEAGRTHGFDGTALFHQDLFRAQPFSHAATVPDATNTKPTSGEKPRQHSAPDLTPTATRLAERYQAIAERTPLLAQAIDQSFTLGSNEWAVSGRHTKTGTPILANDPHMPLGAPSTLYPIGLRGAAFDVQGESVPGAPYVVLGQNRHIAWGASTNPMDVTDAYVEQVRLDPTSPSGLSTVYKGRLEHVEAVPQTYRANARVAGQSDVILPVPPSDKVPPVTLIVPRRNLGPIIGIDAAAGTALSVQYTGFSPTRELETFRRFDQATNLEEFTAALPYFDVGSQNFAYIDVTGHIAHFTSAEMPLREDLEAGKVSGRPPYLLRDGTGGNEWLPATHRHPNQAVPYEILPPQEMPHVIDPPAGFFVNANNDPAGTTLDNDPLNQRRATGGIYYLNRTYDGLRGQRITDLLRAETSKGPRLTSSGTVGQQADTTLLDAQFFVPHVLTALKRARQSTQPDLRALGTDAGVVEAVGRLAAWDHSTPTGLAEGYDGSDANGQLSEPTSREIANSVAATIYTAWRGQAIDDIIDARLDHYRLEKKPGNSDVLKALKTLLARFGEEAGKGTSGIDFFAVPGVANAADRRDILLLRSVRKALDLLSGSAFHSAFHGSTRQSDYRWGELHRITFESVLGEPWSIPPGGGFSTPTPNLPGIPADGGYGSVDVGPHSLRAATPAEFAFDAGAARRLVAQPAADGINAVSSLPGGTSETLGDPRYANLLGAWLTNDTYPVRQRLPDMGGNPATYFIPIIEP